MHIYTIHTDAHKQNKLNTALVSIYILLPIVNILILATKQPSHLVPLQSKVFWFLFLQLSFWDPLYRMQSVLYVQRLTLDGCFDIHLLKVHIFSALIKNEILWGGLWVRFVTS